MSRRQKRKQKPSIRPQQAATPSGQPAGKSPWLRSDIIAMVSLIIAITATVISLTIPEIRQFLGLDHPSQLRTEYIGQLISSNGGPSNAQQSTALLSLFFDWESPGGDIAGTITTDQTQCSFQGTVTTDHLKLTCRNPDLSFDGYIYADGHIKGTLSSSSGVTIWYLNRASANIPPAAPPSTPTPLPSPTPTPTPVLFNLSQITIYSNPVSEVDSVAWSPDGKWLAFADLETVQVWDAQTGKPLLTYQSHNNGVCNLVTSIAWSPDSRKLAFDNDKTVQVWDAQTGRLLLTYRGHSNYGISIARSPNGKWLASASYQDGTVQVWDAQTGRLLAMYESHKTASVGCIAWSPDSRQLALGTVDGTVQLLILR